MYAEHMRTIGRSTVLIGRVILNVWDMSQFRASSDRSLQTGRENYRDAHGEQRHQDLWTLRCLPSWIAHFRKTPPPGQNVQAWVDLLRKIDSGGGVRPH